MIERLPAAEMTGHPRWPSTRRLIGTVAVTTALTVAATTAGSDGDPEHFTQMQNAALPSPDYEAYDDHPLQSMFGVAHTPTPDWVRGEVDCMRTEYELPTDFDPEATMEAIASTEFFIDDTSALEEVVERIVAADSHHNVEDIVSTLFQEQGITVLFDTVKPSYSYYIHEEKIELNEYKEMLRRFVTVLGSRPAKEVREAKTIYLSNEIYETNETEPSGYRTIYGKAFADRSMAFDINVFSNIHQGHGLYIHEIAHLIHENTCADGFTAEDQLIIDLRRAHHLTAENIELSADDYSLSTLPVSTRNYLLEHVIASEYARRNVIEDVAETAERVGLGDYPDQDGTLVEDTLWHQRQTIVMGRTITYLQLPQLAHLAMLNKYYGPATHPRYHEEFATSHLQPRFLDRITHQSLRNGTTHEGEIAKFQTVEVQSPDGNHELMYYEFDPKSQIITLYLRVFITDDQNNCVEAPEVIETEAFAKAIMTQIEPPGTERSTNIYVFSAGSTEANDCRVAAESKPK